MALEIIVNLYTDHETSGACISRRDPISHWLRALGVKIRVDSSFLQQPQIPEEISFLDSLVGPNEGVNNIWSVSEYLTYPCSGRRVVQSCEHIVPIGVQMDLRVR